MEDYIHFKLYADVQDKGICWGRSAHSTAMSINAIVSQLKILISVFSSSSISH
jgi:hypothetical protein